MPLVIILVVLFLRWTCFASNSYIIRQMLNGAGLRIYERFVRVMNDLMIFLTEIRASHAGRGVSRVEFPDRKSVV